MKVILYMAMTANGFIAKKNDDVDFVSAASWQSYRDLAARTGNIIVGRRTFDLMQKAGDMDGLENIHIVVVSAHPKDVADPLMVSFADSPRSALQYIEERGLKEALVAGGATLNASFLKENLIDEIYLDIEPTLLGAGIPLAGNSDFEKSLKLLGTKQISENEIQLHYQIKK